MPKKRWTIEKMQEYRKFCGWDTLKELMNSIGPHLRGPAGEILIHNHDEQAEAKAAIATTFETGCRIMEVLGQVSEEEYQKYRKGEVEELEGVPGLYKKDFEIGGEKVIVTHDLEKQYVKSKDKKRWKAQDGTKMRFDEKPNRPAKEYNGYETERKIKIRRIEINKSEPLISGMMNWVDSHTGKLFSYKYNHFYRVIKEAGKEIGEDFPPHRLRAERATQMLLEYDLDAEDLKEWFSWRRLGQAMDYTTLKPRTSEKMMRKAEEKFGK